MGMMDRCSDFSKSLEKLEFVYKKSSLCAEEDKEIYRDSAIQRFELTVETFWKCIKNFLLQKEGVHCYSPKSCIRELYFSNYVTKDESIILLEMIDDRNMTVHTYDETLAEKIYKRIKSYIPLLKKLKNQLL